MPNPKIRNLTPTLLSDNWYTLKKYRFDYRNRNDEWVTQEREAYDRGNGAAILLYHPEKKTVILTRQFRLPTYVNGNDDGMLIEACASILETENPEECIKKECIEETGYHVENVRKVFEAYMSPGSVTEILHFFVAGYDASLKQPDGGGVAEIEILELDYARALHLRPRPKESVNGKLFRKHLPPWHPAPNLPPVSRVGLPKAQGQIPLFGRAYKLVPQYRTTQSIGNYCVGPH